MGGVPSSFRATRPWWALVLVLAALIPALAAVLPPPNLLAMALGLLGAEWMPWLVLVTLIGMALAAKPSPAHRARLAVLILGTVVLALAIRQFALIPRALGDADAELAQVVGDAPVPAVMPARPLGLSGWFRGVAADRPIVEGAFTIPAADGSPLDAVFYHPHEPGRHPLVVVIHGGGWIGGSVYEAQSYNEALASHGFSVISIGYRLAPAHRFPAQLDDVRAALAWIRANPKRFAADPTRMVLVGRSAGAHLALLAAYSGEPVQAVVAYYSPIDLVSGHRVPPSPDPLHVRPLMEALLGGTPDDREALYRAASPITFAHGRQPPTLLISAGRDHAIVREGTGRMVAALRRDGNAVAWITIPWSEHAFDIPPQGLGGRIAHWHCERFLHWAVAQPSR